MIEAIKKYHKLLGTDQQIFRPVKPLRSRMKSQLQKVKKIQIKYVKNASILTNVVNHNEKHNLLR